jgi:hypothetical protein
MYAITPYRPNAVRASATSANADTSTKLSRRGATLSPMTSSIVRTAPIGRSRSTAATADLRSPDVATTSLLERITMVIVRAKPEPRLANC